MSDAAAQVQTRWWWVRHAVVPSWASGGRIYGAADVACALDDRPALAGLAATLPRPENGAIWLTSDLRRTIDTAGGIAEAGGFTIAPDALPALREQHLGGWQGESYHDLVTKQPDELARFWADPGQRRPPDGESFADVMARVGETIDMLMETYAGRDIVVVAHGGVIRAALARALDLSPAAGLRVAIDNLALTRLEHYSAPTGMAGAGWRVVTVNERVTAAA